MRGFENDVNIGISKFYKEKTQTEQSMLFRLNFFIFGTNSINKVNKIRKRVMFNFKRRVMFCSAIIVFTIICLSVFFLPNIIINKEKTYRYTELSETEPEYCLPGSEEFKLFMTTIFNIYDQHDIKTRVGTGKRLVVTEPSLLSELELLKFMDVESSFVLEASEKHSSINKRLPQFKVHLYKGNGYVITASRDKYWYAYSVIKMIRTLGSNLPVEIIIPTIDDYNIDFCQNIISNMNAKCILVPEVYGLDVVKKFNLKYLQIISILTSSFSKVLYLTDYNYPIANPDQIFNSLLLKQNGMILWSDKEPRTTSPLFYSIQNKKIGKVTRFKDDLDSNPNLYRTHKNTHQIDRFVSYHDREGTIHDFTNNNGQIIIDKYEHLNTLLLAFWYQIQGEGKFSLLITQDSSVDATKELFAAAANFKNQKYYQVFRKPKYSDQLSVDGKPIFEIKWNPVDDFNSYVKVIENIAQESQSLKLKFHYDYQKAFEMHFDLKPGVPLFIDLVGLKMDPIQFYSSDVGLSSNGDQKRLLPTFANESIDLEENLWKFADELICKSKHWQKLQNDIVPDDFCDSYIPSRQEFLSQNK